MDDLFDGIFSRTWELISELNVSVVKGLAGVLGIDTPIYVASEVGEFPENPDERLIAIVKHFKGNTYLAGSGGRGYMELQKYEKHGIEVIFQDYRHPEYEQLFGDFEANMSVIDLILNHGDGSLDILRGRE
jgi:hypothetical protein